MHGSQNERKLQILVVGMGAVGTTLAARLRLAGHMVSAFARGETLNAIGSMGLRVPERSRLELAGGVRRFFVEDGIAASCCRRACPQRSGAE